MFTLVDLGTLGSEGFVVTGPSPDHSLGSSVTDAGDINGDGFDDFAVSTASGRSYVLFGRASGLGDIDLSDLQPTEGFEIYSGYYSFVTDISAAGDINGDGFDDLVVGGTFYYGWYGNYDVAWVVFGKDTDLDDINLATLTPTEGFSIWGDYSYSASGFNVSAVGDVNGDGLADVILSDHSAYPVGTAYVIFGRDENTPINLNDLAAADGFKIVGQSGTNDYAGFSVSGAGDVNGDGYDDIVIGAPLSDAGGINSGVAYVIFGKASGFGTINLANLSASAGFVIQGDRAGDMAGWSVSGAGDINGDGFDDIVLGAPPANSPYGARAGAAYVIFGKAGGFATVDLSTLSGSAGFVILGDEPMDHAGWSVSAAGDVNNDGFDDIIIGAPTNDNLRNGAGTVNAGEAYVIFGKEGGFGTIDLTNLAPADGIVIQGAAADDQAGFSVSGAGDVDGDGYDDLLVGAPNNDLGGMDAGAAYVISGRLYFASDVKNDFNGDGRSDVLWLDSTGTLREWLAQEDGNFAPNPAATYLIADDWVLEEAGDFNGDGRDDLVLRDGDGTVVQALGRADGGFDMSSSPVYQTQMSWILEGAGDFDGDGRDDIIWRDAAGVMSMWLGQSGGHFVWNSNAMYQTQTSWSLEEVGDFNGDGRDDLLWRDSAGRLSEWLGQANGSFSWNSAAVYVTPISWILAGSGDFNGDGRDDLLWRDANGTLSQWLGQANGAFAWNAAANYPTPASWDVTQVGDFNGDGRDDILWRDTNDTVAEWLGQADGTFVWNAAAIYNVPADWVIQPADLV